MSGIVRNIGVVVVGLGIAGRVRVRDLKEETCSLKLKGVVSRRPVELEGVEAFSFEEALSKSDVEALIICTEPVLHEEYVRRGLESGKHVLVEYPLAQSSKTAKALYQLAESKGLVLYEENIGLLTEGHRVLQAKVSQTPLKSANYFLKGSYNGWIEDFEKSGLPFITGISPIQTMLTLLGDLKVVGGKFNKFDDRYDAHAELTTQTGKPINIKLERFQTKVQRETKSVYEFEDGEVIDTAKLPLSSKSKPGLFMQDMENFSSAIKDGKITDDQKQLTIHSLEIAETIHSFF